MVCSGLRRLQVFASCFVFTCGAGVPYLVCILIVWVYDFGVLTWLFCGLGFSSFVVLCNTGFRVFRLVFELCFDCFGLSGCAGRFWLC